MAEPRPFLPDDRRSLVRATVAVFAAVTAAALVVVRFDEVLAVFGVLWGVLVPLLAGSAVAYVLNLIMVRWERIYFPRSKSRVVAATRRPVCIVLSVASVAALVALVVWAVGGELRHAGEALLQGAAWVAGALSQVMEGDGLLSALLSGDAASWRTTVEQMAERIVSEAGGARNLASLLVGAGGRVAGGVVDVVVAAIFALFLLFDKERVLTGLDSLGRAVLSERAYGRTLHVCAVANECFSRFVSGQCLESTILGLLCAIGMQVLGLPFAGSVGLCVGVTSLVPFIGAWVGGIVGALMILSVSPMQAVWFVVFLVILQQIEGHVIYPNVVGATVDVPGIQVFVAVFVGGSLFGILGVLLSVPVVATARRLLHERREAAVLAAASEGGAS
ncbi:AI-2E family transporter [Eggerthella sp. YY7918]|uniref:AI-2E family transporter n=1 Tax=Eggerthella sp. (strain YY7918) TaxID=502558 RepID=UPI00130524ED|nr:AI-2E family transporter [Eggerthella sp. YY7918]